MADSLDFNQLPWFDDWDEDKLFHRILFKPGVAVQARELTQLQTILQNQIERFGTHIFKNGSRVLGGKFDPQDPIDYVRVTLASATTRTELEGKELTGASTGIVARVIYAEADPNENGITVIFVRYTNTKVSGDTTITEFANETLNWTDDDGNPQTLLTESTNTTGTGSIFGIQEGVLFTRGFFVKFNSQKIALDPFNSSASKRVYFKSEFSTVNSNQDTSLLDNAQGFNNYNAPGADRLKCTLSLVVSSLTEDLVDEDHTLLLEIRNGQIYERQERTQYNEIMDELAKRTFDESGDYLVRGWNLFSREHLDTGTNGGLYANSEGGDTDKLAVGIEKGLAYVKGYEVETLNTRYIDVDKSTTYNHIDDQSSIVKMGNSTVVDEIVGLPDPDRYHTVNLYDTAENRVTGKTAYDSAASGSVIGTAIVGGYIEESGQFGQNNAQMRLYLAEVNMNAGQSFADVRAVGNTSSFFSDVVLDSSNNATLEDTSVESRLYYVGSDYVRTVKDDTDTVDTSFTYARKDSGLTVATNGTVSSSALPASESLPYGTGTLDTATKDNIFLVVTDAGGVDTSDLAGTVTITGSNTTVVGTGTAFTNLNAGDYIKIDGTINIIASIESDTSLTLTAAASAVTANTYAKSYVKGSIVDLNSKGADNGSNRSVSIDGGTPTILDIDLDETFDATFTADIVHRVIRNPIQPIAKTLRSNRYVTFDVGSYANNTHFWLGVPDIYRVKSVRQSANAFTSNTDGTDVSSSFVLNSGQSPSAYNTGYIKSSSAIANTQYLLVQFDYFESAAGPGYYSIDSYPIDDTVESDTTIKTANIPEFQGLSLRNFIDCRPQRATTATPATSVGAAPSNPTNSTTWTVDTNGLRLPVTNTNLNYDYSYYLARRDVMVIDPQGKFSVIAGEPDENPALPKISDEYMRIANIYVPPYPSYAGTYARILRNPQAGVAIDKRTFSRHTMRDIGKIKSRVKDLEVISSLNMLETDVWELNIPDENGLDRFKNGIFVEPFADHSLADAGNIDYKIAIDNISKEARPVYTVDGFESNYSTGTTNIVSSDNLVSLTFNEETFIEQPYATTTRNVELSSYRFIGLLNLNPDIDTWVDSTTVDRTIDLNSDLAPGQEIVTNWNAPEINITGAISGKPGWRVYERFRGEGGNSGIYKGDRYLRKSNQALTDDTIANRLGLDPNERNINTLPNLYQALTEEELASRYRGTYDSLAAAKKAAWSGQHRNRQNWFVVNDGKVTSIENVEENYIGVESTINITEDVNQIGSFVTDATLIPYIRPQTIQVSASGLKRNTRYYVFFDGEDMSSYVTPMSSTTQSDVFPPLSDYYASGGEGDALWSDEYGNVFGALRLPSGNTKRFRVGTSEVVVTDSNSNSKASSSFARANFVSAGLNLQKQNTILSTKTISQENRIVTRQETYTQTSIINNPSQFEYLAASCSAYSFYVDEPNDVEGVFLSSVDIWLSALSEDYGVWFEIREMSNDGGISRNQVPYSEVWMYRDDARLNVSNNGIDNSTNVNFKSPVYLFNKTQYAFVIHTEGLNPDTYFWVSELGGSDVSSGNAVTSRPLTGTFYTTNNNLNWDIVPDVDLKVKFNRAAFGGTTASEKSGTATFNIEDVDYITANTSLPGTFFNNGEPVRSSEVLTLALGSANVAVGDVLLSSNNSANATILSISGANYYMDGFDFVEGDTISVRAAANTDFIKDTGTVSTVNFGVGVIDKIDTTNNRFDIIHSNGRFFEGAVLRSILPHRHKTVRNGSSPLVYENADTTLPNPFAPNGSITLPVGAATSNTTITAPSYTLESNCFTKFDYTSILVRPGYLNFKDTTCNFKIKTRHSSNNTTTSTAETVVPNNTLEFNTVRTLLSRSVEVADYSGNRSLQYEVTMSTPSDYISPIVDSSLLGSVHRMNSLNNDTTGETDPYNGSLSSKYISKVVDLEDDNTAEDMLVILKEYRPDTSGIKVWVRIKSKYDSQSIYQKNWQELTTTKNAISSNVNKRNYIDTTYQFDDNDRTGTFSEVQYPFTIDATALVTDTSYTIVSLGSEPETTDFTTVGAANNDIGTTFTANNVATGTGTVRLSTDTVFTGYNQFQVKVGLTGTNEAVYPKIAQLRVIALQQ